MKRSLFYIISILCLFTNCKKDIDIDYHQIAPIYVVEGSVSNNGTEVRGSRTNAMDDNNGISDISNATVILTADNGQQWNIPYNRNGFYRSSTLKGEAGITYTLEVTLDGQTYTSTSTMQRKPTLNKFRFVWMKAASERILFGDLRLQDIPNEDNWYFAHIYRNGTGYRWAVKRDDQNPNSELQQLFSFAREDSDDEDLLYENDKLHIEVRAIDQKSYDYLYSMQIMDNTGTNPITNFTGGCLGYFSAYSQITYDCEFHESDVEDVE